MLSFLLVAAQVAVATPGPRADSILPNLRASHVYVAGDTAWFLPDALPERALRLPAVGYAARAGRWFVAELTWRQAEKRRDAPGRSGEAPASAVQPYPLHGDFALTDTLPRVDPRYARRAEPDDHITQRFLLLAGQARMLLEIRLGDSARRALYLAGGGHLRAGQSPPPFNTTPSRWASDGNTIAFAFPAAAPPRPEAPWLPLDEQEKKYDAFLSGLVVFDPASKRLIPIVHPRLVEHSWAGLEIATGGLWVAPSMVADSDLDYADAPSLRAPPPLARYDLARRTWRFFTATDLPLREPFDAMAGDGSRLYFVSADGIAILDTRTMRWDARFYAHSAYRLPDGADTAVTMLVHRRPVADTAATTPAQDSTALLEAFAAELAVRHQSDLVRDLRRYAPFDSIAEIVGEMDSQRGGRWDTGEVFVTAGEAAMNVLQRPEFRPYLREALWRTATQDFALDALRPAGQPVLQSALRATLDSGSLDAAVVAADSLIARGDTAGLGWIRRQLANPAPLLERGPALAGQPLWRMLYLLAREVQARGDSADLARMLHFMDAAAAMLYPEERAGFGEPLFSLRGAGLEARLARALETRPLLWMDYLGRLAFTDTTLLDDRAVQASASRMAAALLTLPENDVTTMMMMFTPSFPGERYRRSPREIARQVRDNQTNIVLLLAGRLDPLRLIPPLIGSLARDTTDAARKASALVRLSGNDAAPRGPRIPADYAPLAQYWKAWWRDHAFNFVPPSRTAGEAAERRWLQRIPK